MPDKKLIKMAIVGRPNVGKSSLFNRITGSRNAIVEPKSGTTRDRLYADIDWKGKTFTIIDTGGFESSSTSVMPGLILKQLDMAIEEADILIFVTDAGAGIVPQDEALSARLRKTSKKIFLVVNKVDDSSDTTRALEFFELGLGEPYPVSAVNGSGIEKLLNAAVLCVEEKTPVNTVRPVNVAIVGRPNVGKSSYLNNILKEERAIVHEVAGTTRDALDTDFEYKGRSYRIIDTAGMRHDLKLERAADFYGEVRAKEAIKRSDVTIALIDAYEGIKEDDSRILELCIAEGKALIVAVNKWDLVKGFEMKAYKDMMLKKMSLIKNFPVVFISAKTGRNILQSFDLVWPLYEKTGRTMPVEELAAALKSINELREIKGKRIKFLYLKQQAAGKPVFIIGFKDSGLVNENSRRYVENFLRTTFDLEGVPVKVVLERKKD